MKKTLVALSVLAAATSAQAIEIYNQDGVTVGLHGDIEVVYMNDFQSSSMKQEIQDADFGFDVRYAINDEFTFGGYWEFDGSDDTNSKITRNGDTYVAVYSKTYGSIKFGRLCTAVDDLGIGSDYQYGISTYLDNNTNECADEGVRYDYDNGTFYTTIGLVQDKLGNDVQDKATDTDYMDARVGYRVADFDLSAFYSNTDVDADFQASPDGKGLKDHSGYGAEVRFAGIENVNLAIAYYATNSDLENDDNNVVAFAADYTMNKWTFAAGYSIGDHDYDGRDDKDRADTDLWFVNAGYGVAPNTTVYAEVGGEDKDVVGYDSDVALAIGVKAEF